MTGGLRFACHSRKRGLCRMKVRLPKSVSPTMRPTKGDAMRKFIMAATAAMILPGAAFAHTGHGDISGFSSGLLHPLSGADHLLAMVAVGLIAALCGGRMLCAMPLAFMGAMLAGASFGLTQLALPGGSLDPWLGDCAGAGGGGAVTASFTGPGAGGNGGIWNVPRPCPWR